MDPIRQRLSELFPSKDGYYQYSPVGGGSINETGRILWGGSEFFCKINSATKFPHLFLKEKKGLERIAQQGLIKTAAVIDHFETGGHQFLLLEWISPGTRTTGFWKQFGKQLAALHLVHNSYFGWEEDNYMGSVEQGNKFTGRWEEFFIHRRLESLIDKCIDKKLLHLKHIDGFRKLYREIPGIFNEEEPCLLHGDLWSGNFMCNTDAEPVLVDPAVYFGHRSMDLGMTTLFGGFSSEFYEAYHYHYPLPANHKEQWEICNLYPLLIHLLLFGQSYLPSIEKVLIRYR